MAEGEPIFVAKDVCQALGIKSTAGSALRLLDGDEKGLNTVQTLGGPQKLVTVTEAGLYRLILRSRKPEARAFDRWVRHEVLPAIRKTGGYGGVCSDLPSPVNSGRVDDRRGTPVVLKPLPH